MVASCRRKAKPLSSWGSWGIAMPRLGQREMLPGKSVAGWYFLLAVPAIIGIVPLPTGPL